MSIIDRAKRPLVSLWDQGVYYVNMMKTAKGCYDNYSIGPIFFKYIGSETKGVLFHDYLSKSLRLQQNSKNFMNVAAGSMVFPPNSVQKMMLNVNHVNTSVSLNGTVGDNWMAKFSFDGILGAQTKAVLYLPTPSFQSKIEFQSLHRYAALTGSFGTGNRPCLHVSCMLGTKLGAVGCQYKLDPATSEFNCSAGLSVQTPCISLGLIIPVRQWRRMGRMLRDTVGLEVEKNKTRLGCRCCWSKNFSQENAMVGFLQPSVSNGKTCLACQKTRHRNPGEAVSTVHWYMRCEAATLQQSL